MVSGRRKNTAVDDLNRTMTQPYDRTWEVECTVVVLQHARELHCCNHQATVDSAYFELNASVGNNLHLINVNMPIIDDT